jgi:hypothetical protein
VLPATAVAPIDNDTPLQMLVFEMVVAVGKGLTVTIKESSLMHPLFVVSTR